jgi:hypothetical protein
LLSPSPSSLLHLLLLFLFSFSLANRERAETIRLAAKFHYKNNNRVGVTRTSDSTQRLTALNEGVNTAQRAKPGTTLLTTSTPVGNRVAVDVRTVTSSGTIAAKKTDSMDSLAVLDIESSGVYQLSTN